MKNECSCDICKAACKSKPGWFLPAEAEMAASELDMSFDDFFKKYLSVDWFCSNGIDYYILSPAAKGNSTGDMFPYNPAGECVFFDGDKCMIHKSKPFECKEFSHGDSIELRQNRHKETALAWKNHDDYIASLLGKEPERPEPESMFEKFGFFNLKNSIK